MCHLISRKIRENKLKITFFEVVFTEKIVKSSFVTFSIWFHGKIRENKLNNFFWSWFHAKFVKIKVFHSYFLSNVNVCKIFLGLSLLQRYWEWEIINWKTNSLSVLFEFDHSINTRKTVRLWRKFIFHVPLKNIREINKFK